ncbi:hypothetical protein TEQG_06810 [Trichophyton equinum CBS 127.97]|uniref:Uncharacterized protein n=1 Tax=Trichophyton equinum (strain ATCC MYA-4606 / CBS 127.97) TaxID=559882 RepID=F2Q0W0_TRIEC|nr:hypothetical protein TEQG_06810 [Trichophyton equinum CBS 127.97]
MALQTRLHTEKGERIQVVPNVIDISGSQSQPAAYHQLLNRCFFEAENLVHRARRGSRQANNCWHNGPEERCLQPAKHLATEDETTGEISCGLDVMCTSPSLAPSSATRQLHHVGPHLESLHLPHEATDQPSLTDLDNRLAREG